MRLAVLLAVPMLMVAAAAPSYADDAIGVSTDGVHWSQHLQGSLFSPPGLWVPGDATTSTFYVRDQGPTTAGMTVQVRIGPSALSRRVAVSVQVAGSAWTPVQGDGRWVAFPGGTVAVGAPQQVRMRAVFARGSRNPTQSSRLPYAVRVRLVGAGAGGNPDGGGPGTTTPGGPGTGSPGTTTGATGGLPNTGAPPVGWLLVGAAACLGLGAGLTSWSRRHR
jgi:LPXTG-motif cell wall-anchored protein